MRVTLEIPDDLITPLHEALGSDLPRAALEQFALQGYKSGKLSRYQVQQLLGFADRWETEAWLGKKGANLHYTSADLEADRRTLDGLLGPAGH